MFKKVVVLCLLALLAFSITLETDLHEQLLPTTNTNFQGGTAAQYQNHKPGFWPVKGDPYGNNKETMATCFQAPCF